MAPIQIYISFARADKRFAEVLRDSLRDEFRHWPDAPSLFLSDADSERTQQFEERMEWLIEGSVGMIVVLSEAWLHSEWCRRELEIFARHRGAGAADRMVAVSKEKFDLRNFPAILRRASRYDCSEWTGEFEHSLRSRDPRFFELTERIAEHLQHLMASVALPEAQQASPSTAAISAAVEEVEPAENLVSLLPDDPGLADLLFQRIEFNRAEDANDKPSMFVSYRSVDPVLTRQYDTRKPDPWNDVVAIPELTKVARDTVDVTAFAPKSAHPDTPVLVQIFLHLTEQLERAQKIARGLDSRTKPRISTLQIDIPRGERVDVALTCKSLGIAQQTKNIRWSGEPSSCHFLLDIPGAVRQENHFVHVELFVGGLPVGELMFDLNVRERCDPADRKPQPQGKSSRRYRHAFLSYASADRVEVLRHAHLLNVLRTKFFQDLLSLEPGERWQRRLYEEIDRCDLFLLFWCEHAAKSDWVIREAEYALERQKASPKGLPHIRPIILHGPRVRAPGQLAELHFNDPIAAVIAGEEARRSSGG